VFLETDENIISHMIYRGEIVLVIESKIKQKQRILSGGHLGIGCHFFVFMLTTLFSLFFSIYYYSGLLLCNQFLSSVTMDRMSIETRMLVVKTFYQSNESGAEIVRRLRTLLRRDGTLLNV